jgi:Spy/CpxP family protein refolding chaperone
MKKLFASAAVVAVALSVSMLTLSPVAFTESAEPGTQVKKPCEKKGWGHKRGMHHKKMAEKLNLTPEQQEQMKALKKSFYEQNKDALGEMKASYKKLRDLKQQGNASPEEVAALKASLKQQREALKPQSEALRAQMKTILTPEQVQQMEAWKQKRLEKHQKHNKSGKLHLQRSTGA